MKVGIDDTKMGASEIRTIFSLSLMECRKIVMLLIDDYGEERVREMLENIKEYNPETN